jgi:hypothetical protein
MKRYQTPNPQCASLVKMHDYAVQARSTANCTFLVPNHYIHKTQRVPCLVGTWHKTIHIVHCKAT